SLVFARRAVHRRELTYIAAVALATGHVEMDCITDCVQCLVRIGTNVLPFQQNAAFRRSRPT
ncbi:MAG TPA: hypothetical protein VGM27_32210, partial [Acidobacteriaceae bacterium]